MGEPRHHHTWHPIEGLTPADGSRSFPELDTLRRIWQERADDLEHQRLTQRFLLRMIRSWSIETGILEGLYTLDRGKTLTFVEQGYDAALLSSADTNLPPGQLVTILEDHHRAAEGLFAFVKQGRALGTSYVMELHQVLTSSQTTCDAVDSLDQWVKVPLLKGDWKQRPNNPGDPVSRQVCHEYCPPEQVASEMDRLVALHAGQQAVHFIVQAAWLHHRFTQIHPFQDGNGRVARALASLVCIRGNGFPFVVLRDDKETYIRALQQADRGDLAPLIELIERQQRAAFLRWLGLSQQVLEEGVGLEALLANARARIDAAAADAAERSTALTDRAAMLLRTGFEHLAHTERQVREALGDRVEVALFESTDPNRHWFRNQIQEAAAALGYVPTLSGNRRWLHLRLRSEVVASFVVAFHHVGKVEAGIMAAAAFLQIRAEDDAGDAADAASTTIHPACRRVFTFSADRAPEELVAAFSSWLDESTTVALELWRRSL